MNNALFLPHRESLFYSFNSLILLKIYLDLLKSSPSERI